MKARINESTNANEKSTKALIDEIKEQYKDVTACSFFISSCKAIKFIDLIYVVNNRIKFFTCPCLKQGSRKRIKGDKVVRFRHGNDMLLIGDSSVREISEAELLKHTLEYAVPFAMAKSRFVPVFIKSKKLGIDFSQFFDGDGIVEEKVEVEVEPPVVEAETVEETTKEVIAETETETVEETTEEAIAETETETVEETTEEAISEEDHLIERLVNLEDNSTTNSMTKALIYRMMNIGANNIDDTFIDKTADFDSKYLYCQEICQQLIEKTKTEKTAKSAAIEINKFIHILFAISFEYKRLSIKAEQDRYMLAKTLEKVSNETADIYNTINSKISRIEEENSEKKLAEQKVSDIMSNLSDLEKELLMKSLGLKPDIDVDIITDPTPVISSTEAVDGNKFTIVMSDGNTRSIDNSWSEILGHLRQISLKRETVNISVFQYIADKMSEGMNRKELIEVLGSQHYAKKALDICSELGLYKLDRSLNGKKRSAAAAAKGGRTLSEHSQIKKRVIEEDIRQKAAKICAE